MPPIANEDIASSAFKANPFQFYARLRSEAPVHQIKLPDKRNACLVTRYNDVLNVLKSDRFVKDKINARTPPWLPGMFKPLARNMLDLDVPDHTRLRGLVQKVFTPRLVENLRQRIQDLADELLNRVQAETRTGNKAKRSTQGHQPSRLKSDHESRPRNLGQTWDKNPAKQRLSCVAAVGKDSRINGVYH